MIQNLLDIFVRFKCIFADKLALIPFCTALIPLVGRLFSVTAPQNKSILVKKTKNSLLITTTLFLLELVAYIVDWRRLGVKT